MQERSAEMTAQWQSERDKLAGARDLKERIDRARAELDIAKREGNLAVRASCHMAFCPNWSASWQMPKEPSPRRWWPKRSAPSKSHRLSNDGQVFRRRACLRVNADKLLRMEDHLHSRVIGQTRCGAGFVQRGAPLTGRSERRGSPFGLVPVSWTDGCGQDRADQGRGGVFV